VAAHKLILLPADPTCPAVGTELLAAELQAIGLIGPPARVNKETFYPSGENFLQLISFLGCSPSIELEPPADPLALAVDSAAGRFCHVFLSSTDTLRFRSGLHPPAPRCPQCHTPLADWPSRLHAWQKTVNGAASGACIRVTSPVWASENPPVSDATSWKSGESIRQRRSPVMPCSRRFNQ
jgi:hypothetical protein